MYDFSFPCDLRMSPFAFFMDILLFLLPVWLHDATTLTMRDSGIMVQPDLVIKYEEGAMRHKSFKANLCPVARSLDTIGEWWSLLIVRDALGGIRRFSDFQKS